MAVSGDDGLGLDEDQRVSPVVPNPRDPDPQQTVNGSERHVPRPGPFQDLQLVPQREDLKLQGRP